MASTYYTFFQYQHYKLYKLIVYHIVHTHLHSNLLFCSWGPLDYRLWIMISGYLVCIIGFILYLLLYGLLSGLVLFIWGLILGLLSVFSTLFMYLLIFILIRLFRHHLAIFHFFLWPNVTFFKLIPHISIKLPNLFNKVSLIFSPLTFTFPSWSNSKHSGQFPLISKKITPICYLLQSWSR